MAQQRQLYQPASSMDRHISMSSGHFKSMKKSSKSPLTTQIPTISTTHVTTRSMQSMLLPQRPTTFKTQGKMLLLQMKRLRMTGAVTLDGITSLSSSGMALMLSRSTCVRRKRFRFLSLISGWVIETGSSGFKLVTTMCRRLVISWLLILSGWDQYQENQDWQTWQSDCFNLAPFTCLAEISGTDLVL